MCPTTSLNSPINCRVFFFLVYLGFSTWKTIHELFSFLHFNLYSSYFLNCLILLGCQHSMLSKSGERKHSSLAEAVRRSVWLSTLLALACLSVCLFCSFPSSAEELPFYSPFAPSVPCAEPSSGPCRFPDASRMLPLLTLRVGWKLIPSLNFVSL